MTKNVVSASPTSQKLFELLRRFPERLELFPGLEDGALPMRMKTTVLAQEVIRRERNTSRNVNRSTRRKIRNKFVLKLRMSGYSWRQRLNIMLSGLRG